MTKCYLFTWEETYLLHKELQKRKDGFLKKHWQDTVLSMSLWQYTSTEIVQAICSNSLFSENKLIIINWIPWETTSVWWTSDLEEKIINHRNNFNENYFYIFISYKPDKRKKSFKFFSENCEVKTFSQMDMRTLPKFINEEIKQHLDKNHEQINIDKETAIEIINIAWDNWRNLAHECEKIAISINMGKQISTDLIKEIITPLTESNNFWILETLIKKSQSIYIILDKLSKQGESRQATQGSLLWWLKSIISFWLCIKNKQETKSLWLPPFTLSKYNWNKENIILDLESYISIYKDLINFDFQIKNWNTNEKWYRLFIKEKVFNYFKI